MLNSSDILIGHTLVYMTRCYTGPGSGIALPVDKLTISLTRKDTVTILQKVNLAHRRKLKSSFQSIPWGSALPGTSLAPNGDVVAGSDGHYGMTC